MTVFSRFPERLQHAIAHQLGFATLRPVQELAGEAILDGKNVVVLAPTAGGKTEASMFPIIGALVDAPPSGVGALYIAPIKALLNNQEVRLGEYTSMVGLRRFPTPPMRADPVPPRAKRARGDRARKARPRGASSPPPPPPPTPPPPPPPTPTPTPPRTNGGGWRHPPRSRAPRVPGSCAGAANRGRCGLGWPGSRTNGRGWVHEPGGDDARVPGSCAELASGKSCPARLRPRAPSSTSGRRSQCRETPCLPTASSRGVTHSPGRHRVRGRSGVRTWVTG